MASAYAGMFFVAGSIILFQIAMTRVFAIMMWHHFSYMVISLALVGFGAAGAILTARRDALRTEPPFRSLAGLSTAYGATAILAFVITTRIPVNSLDLWTQKSNLLALFAVYALLTVPLLLGGMVIGMALTRLVSHVSRLYFVDLMGSAAGGAASTFILAAWGNVAAVLSAGAAGMLGALLFSFAAPPRSRLVPATAFALATAATIACACEAFTWEIPFATGKEMQKAEVRLPSATAEVEIAAEALIDPLMGGEFGWVDRTKVPQRLVAQDGTAPTLLIRDAADLAKFKFLDDSQAASAYVCHRATGRTSPDVLAIGVGGGIDVMIALAHDARRVTAVEINPAMIRMVTDTFADYTGRLLCPGGHALSDRIRLVKDEGRSYARRTGETFDIIQMSGVDTYTALATGAYALSESYLYTTDAVRDFYARLNEGGYINYSRFMLAYPRKPRETIRLANIARAALEELGVADPASQIVVFQGMDWASTIIKRGPFLPEEIAALDRFAADEGFMGVAFDPTQDPQKPLRPARAVPPPRLHDIYHYLLTELPGHFTVKPTYLDETRDLALVLFNAIRARGAGALDEASQRITEFVERMPPESREKARSLAEVLVDIGVKDARPALLAFDETRSGFLTLMRGSADARARFLDDYEYDLAPCRDDRPFFFNYNKYSSLWKKRSGDIKNIYHGDFPVGLIVLLGSLVMILLLACVLILLPLRKLRREGHAVRDKARYLAYFSALGLGFMFIEVVMMQKMLVFLGHPTYALSVVLAALLASTGIGSLVSGRFTPDRRTLLRIVTAIVVTTALALVVANNLLPRALGQPLGVRILLVTLTLVPLGFVLGMAFPTGIRIVGARSPALLPWCWAINGITSVFGSLFCIVIAIEAGFSVVMLIAAGVYVLGFLAMLRVAGAAPEARSAS